MSELKRAITRLSNLSVTTREDWQHLMDLTSELEAENERLLKMVATRLLDDIDERIGEKDAE